MNLIFGFLCFAIVCNCGIGRIVPGGAVAKTKYIPVTREDTSGVMISIKNMLVNFEHKVSDNLFLEILKSK